MPLYEYTCKSCRSTITTPTRETVLCNCGGTTRRVWSFTAKPLTTFFQPHYNTAVGAYVTSMSDFNAKLSKRSESLGTTLTPLEPSDVQSGTGLGVTAEGLDTPQHDPNLKATKTYV